MRQFNKQRSPHCFLYLILRLLCLNQCFSKKAWLKISHRILWAILNYFGFNAAFSITQQISFQLKDRYIKYFQFSTSFLITNRFHFNGKADTSTKDPQVGLLLTSKNSLTKLTEKQIQMNGDDSFCQIQKQLNLMASDHYPGERYPASHRTCHKTIMFGILNLLGLNYQYSEISIQFHLK